jgi:hypothetical protein
MSRLRRGAVVPLLVAACCPLVGQLAPPAEAVSGAVASPDARTFTHAGAAHRATTAVNVTGDITYLQPANLYHPDGASASWTVAGEALLLRQEAPLVGITDLTGLFNSDERYAHASLTGFQAVEPPTPCGDGTAAVTTVAYTGITDPSSAIGLANMEVNLYTGTGRIQLNIAESPTRDNEMLAPGTVNVHTHSECYGSVTDNTAVVPVMGEATGLEPLGGYWAFQDLFMGRWKLTRDGAHGWQVHQHRDLSTTSYDSANETVNLSIAGPLSVLKASCALPSVRMLRRATTFRAADAIVRRGGFAKFRNVVKQSRAAPKGHFFVLEGIGNKYAGCGQRHLHVVKSLGWPS